jgi:hypothetical protein
MFCLLLECAFDLILFVLWWKLYVHVARKRRCSFLSLTVTSIACVIVWLNCAFICRMIIVLLLFYGNVITIFTCLNHRIVQSVWMRLLLRTTQTILIFSVEKEKTHLSESSISEISNSVSVVWAHWEVNVFWFVMLTLILMLLIGYSGNSVHRKKNCHNNTITTTQTKQNETNLFVWECTLITAFEKTSTKEDWTYSSGLFIFGNDVVFTLTSTNMTRRIRNVFIWTSFFCFSIVNVIRWFVQFHGHISFSFFCFWVSLTVSIFRFVNGRVDSVLFWWISSTGFLMTSTTPTFDLFRHLESILAMRLCHSFWIFKTIAWRRSDTLRTF